MSDSRRPRSSILFEHVDSARHQKTVKQDMLAHEMMQTYRAYTPLDLQRIKCKGESTLSAAAAAAQKRLSRYLLGSDPLPADLEEFLVDALPEPHRTQAKTALVRRYGSLYVPIPNAEAGPDVMKVSRLAKEFGEAMVAIAPIISDGRIDADDMPLIGDALAQLDDLIGAATAVKHQLQLVTDRGCVVVLRG